MEQRDLMLCDQELESKQEPPGAAGEVGRASEAQPEQRPRRPLSRACLRELS